MKDSTLWARKCAVTGEGMSAGYVVFEDVTIRNEDELIDYMRKEDPDMWDDVSDDFLLRDGYENGDYYYTEWTDLDDMQYIEVDRKLYEIELY